MWKQNSPHLLFTTNCEIEFGRSNQKILWPAESSQVTGLRLGMQPALHVSDAAQHTIYFYFQ